METDSIKSHFNPRSPHGERPAGRYRQTVRRHISIHAPRTGSDSARNQRTPTGAISIHAPRTGSDRVTTFSGFCWSNFNPRSPHGERPHLRGQAGARPLHFNPRSPHGERRLQRRTEIADVVVFQSTLPARGATSTDARRVCEVRISIHAPRTGSDEARKELLEQHMMISIHAPRTGSDAV